MAQKFWTKYFSSRKKSFWIPFKMLTQKRKISNPMSLYFFNLLHWLYRLYYFLYSGLNVTEKLLYWHNSDLLTCVRNYKETKSFYFPVSPNSCCYFLCFFCDLSCFCNLVPPISAAVFPVIDFFIIWFLMCLPVSSYRSYARQKQKTIESFLKQDVKLC